MSELRKAVAQAFAQNANSSPGVTWLDVMTGLQAQGLVHVHSRSERAMVRRTVGNMLAAGELLTVGQRQVAGSKRPMALYALANRRDQADGGGVMLASLLRCWPASPET